MMYHHHQKNLTYGTPNLAEKDQKHENSYSIWYNNHQEAMESDDSGAASPHPLLRRRDHRPLSPEARAEAIVRGQWELMEMVRNMPESSYELSLKDIVEHNRAQSIDHQTVLESEDHRNQSSLQQRTVVKRDDQSKKVERNLTFENKGLFLNIVFPFSFKTKKKNNKNKNSVKVSPKPEGLRSERDWWKKKFTGSSDSDSSRTSSSSSGGGYATGSGGRGGDIGGRKRNGLLSVCWPFFHSRSTKSAE